MPARKISWTKCWQRSPASARMRYPPLVTPTSQIVGTQAVFNVILGERYKMVTKEFKGLVPGDWRTASISPVRPTTRFRRLHDGQYLGSHLMNTISLRHRTTPKKPSRRRIGRADIEALMSVWSGRTSSASTDRTATGGAPPAICRADDDTCSRLNSFRAIISNTGTRWKAFSTLYLASSKHSISVTMARARPDALNKR